MWGHVVYPVMLTREDHMILLQPDHCARDPRVGVGPLVDLVCERDQEHESNGEAVELVVTSNLLLRLVVHDDGLDGEGGKGHKAVVTVGFDEVMSCDSQGIHVMFTEWTNKCLQKVKHLQSKNYPLQECFQKFAIIDHSLKAIDLVKSLQTSQQ